MGAEPTALSGRFEIVRALGAGGMGLVSEAYDTLRKETVALKTLRRVSGEDLYRFKREFRSLADLSHPNLVTLYELFATGDDWYFTMELVTGLPFVGWVRGRASVEPEGDATLAVPLVDETRVRRSGSQAPAVPRRRSGRPVEDRAELYARLRRTSRQLAHALVALHEAGWLHGDVKPSNVLVTPEERVVVLDFGVITELGSRITGEIAGTPVYMAPEQLRCDPPTAASDWYAFGVMLFECMTGRRPIEGGAMTVMSVKAEAPRVPALEELPADAPRDLAELCIDLLCIDPRERPKGGEILRRLGVTPSFVPPMSDASNPPSREPSLAGRASEHAVLRELLAEVERGRGRACLVHAASGIGKTALVESFLDACDAEGRAGLVVLRGRCYEREAVPYKALDSFVDALCHWLRTFGIASVDRYLPEDTIALATAFPVMKRLDAVARRSRAGPAHLENVGRRALTALAVLLRNVAAENTVVVFVDDLQWGDLDSAAFLDLLVTPDGPPVLFLGSFRTEHRAESPLLRAMLEAARVAPGTLVELALQPLSVRELEELIARHFRAAGVTTELAPAIALQAKGSPYFAQELARHVAASLRRGSVSAEAMTLHGVVLARTNRLSPAARSLLDVVAVAGSPLPRRVIESASKVPATNKYFVELAAGHFIVPGVASDEERVVTAHDAIGQAVTASLAPERLRALHLALATALEAGERTADLHQLADHYFRAWPDAPSARVFASCKDAAREAAKSGAYDQAYVHVERAERVARASHLELDVAFQQFFGEIAARAGHMGPATQSLRQALTKSASGLARAEVRLALARIALGQLDTSEAELEVRRGLEELGYAAPRPTLFGMIVAVGMAARGEWTRRLRPSRVGVMSRDARTRVGSALLRLATANAYFKMDRRAFLQVPMWHYPIVLSLGDSPQLAEWYAIVGVIAAAAGRKRFAMRSVERANAIVEKLQQPSEAAPALQFAAHAIHFSGDPVRAEHAMVELLTERGQWLENAEYLTAVADLAWNSLMRGKSELGWQWVLRGLERAAVDGSESRLTKGHTYLCYAGPLLTRMGRAAEGRRRLEEYRAMFVMGRPPDAPKELWRPGQWLAHWTLHLALTDDVGDAFDAAVEAFHALGLTPTSVPLSLRHFYVAQAMGRLSQLEQAPDSARARRGAGWRAARRELARAANHPTLLAHLAILDARHHVGDGDRDDAVARLDEAEALATRHENLWALEDIGSLRARLGSASDLAESREARSKE